MSHVRPDAKIPRHRLSACKKGSHSYGMAQYIGAGIERRVCRTCGAVTIDLTAADDSIAQHLASNETLSPESS